ncbi:MAG: cell division protein FtsB [Gammaproteobacteria bacterium]|nr:cell division protein FtsB [Gammaproteobacteria bacterium]
MRRLSLFALTLMLLALQFRLWVAEGGIAHTHRLKAEVRAQQNENRRLQARNGALEAEVADLKSGVGAIEARARETLGMIRKGETFYLVVSSS